MCSAHVPRASRRACRASSRRSAHCTRCAAASRARRPASQRSGCGGQDGSTEGSGVLGLLPDGANSWTSGGVVGMTRCCTGATNKCAASRRPAAATTKRAATARIILVRRSAQRRGTATARRSTQLAATHADAHRGSSTPRRARSPLLRSLSAHSLMSTDHGTDVLSASTSPATSSRSSFRRLNSEGLAIVSRFPRRRCAAQAVATSKSRALAESLGCADRKLAA